MIDIQIKGVQKSSLIDYPGKVAAVIFLSRCNISISVIYCKVDCKLQFINILRQ